ncbi:MAG: PIN domain-containing protein [Cyanobacteriota bacterium]
MVILYVETNFLMSIATGRDSQANTLLENATASVQIAIPSICCMESLSALEDEIKRRNRFMNELNIQISQLQRDLTSSHAQSLLSHLEQSLIENEALLNDVENRLFQALDHLNTKAEIIPLNGDMLQESLDTRFINKDPTDNLILHCILNHARLHPTDRKVFLSANVKEFNQPEVQAALQDAGVVKYLTRTQDFLGWLESQ